MKQQKTCLSLFFITLFVLGPATLNAQFGPKDGLHLPPTGIERIRAGMPAPDFTLRNFDGSTVTLSDYKGSREVVLVFYRGRW